MKTLIKKRMLVLALASALSTPVYARDFVIGLSPSIAPAEKETIFKKATQFLLESVHPGDEAKVYDAFHNKLIGTFKVPNKRGYDHPKPKAKHNKAVLQKMKAFLMTKSTPNETSANVASKVRFPQFTSFIGENRKSDETTDVILIGNPLYMDFKETSFSMTDGFFPSDGHINASVKKSVYGTKEKKGLLKSMRIHFAYRDVSWHNDLHEQMIKRFWSVYVSEQGGSLVTFTSDLDTVMSRAVDTESTNRRTYTFDKTDNKLEMSSVKREINRRRVNDVFKKSTSAPPPARTQNAYIGKVLVGIKWDCLSCDLDLYARSGNRAKILFYGNTSTPEGTYHKDFLDSPTPVNGLEYIQFKKDVNVKDMLIAVNFYRGNSSGGPKGEIRLELNGAVYAKKFRIRSSSGNGGKDSSKMKYSPHWEVINPMDIVFGR